jgi:hypothetical protein
MGKEAKITPEMTEELYLHPRWVYLLIDNDTSLIGF